MIRPNMEKPQPDDLILGQFRASLEAAHGRGSIVWSSTRSRAGADAAPAARNSPQTRGGSIEIGTPTKPMIPQSPCAISLV
jgi:hypothetical protein